MRRVTINLRPKFLQYCTIGHKSELDRLLTDANLKKCVEKFSSFKFVPESMKLDKNASVLIPLCHVNNNLCLIYTLRTNVLRRHSGQISFPGGMCDNEESPQETAVRETEEEIGIPRENIKTYGCGAPVARFGVLITPTIGYVGHVGPEDIKINEKEVQFAFAVPLSMLIDLNNCRYTQFRNSYTLPVYSVEGFRIWGITAYLTHFFLKCFVGNEYKLELVQSIKIISKK